jgi:hypothetical protein
MARRPNQVQPDRLSHGMLRNAVHGGGGRVHPRIWGNRFAVAKGHGATSAQGRTDCLARAMRASAGYLCGRRCISPKIAGMLARDGRIGQTLGHPNVAFIALDEKGRNVGYEIRGIRIGTRCLSQRKGDKGKASIFMPQKSCWWRHFFSWAVDARHHVRANSQNFNKAWKFGVFRFCLLSS